MEEDGECGGAAWILKQLQPTHCTELVNMSLRAHPEVMMKEEDCGGLHGQQHALH